MPSVFLNGTIDEYVKPFRQSILRKIDFQIEQPEDTEIYEQPYFTYSILPLKKDLLLKGGFQSEKYFDKETVRSLFEIDSETEFYIREKYHDVLAKIRFAYMSAGVIICCRNINIRYAV